MAVTITTAANYWIAPNALTITLNALGEANRIQASVASGAVIMVYMRGIKPADPSDPDTALNGEGLEFDNGHNYRRWPLSISPTYFNSNDEKYVYVAIPRKASVGTDAVVVFPSQKLDIYGYSIKEVPKRNARGQMIDEDGYPTDDITKAVKEEEQDEQLGTDDYWYVWLQGIVTETNGTSLRDWDAHCESGYLDSDEAISSLETDWYKWDPISGTVTFLKEIFMDAGSIFSNLKAKVAEIADLNVTNLLDAIKAKIDDIRSHNFEEGLTDGNGFRLTADNGDGASELEVDFLKVRKKATFMELEIRKETFVGGNQNYSPAGSVIYRVEYLDVNNEPLGYKTKKVPWLLKGFAFLGGPFAGAYHLATKRRVYVGMTDEEWPKCHHFRCYLISDDGTTATRNWWRYGDQAKCQSFNKAASVQSKHDNTYNSGTSVVPDPATPMAEKTYASQPVETSYWWRMVTNTGSKLLEDGYVYDFVDFPYEGWDVVIGGTRHRYSEIEKKGFRDPGSGMPMAGDTLVCIGNRIEEDRMNLINLSTTGDDNDPPSIRGYRGIHNFKMEKSNRVFQISPKETLFRSKHFYLLNDDDEQFRVPLERGEWEIGQRYHWYDRVSWDGSIWLCVVADEYVWQDANGNDYRELDVTDIDQGEGSFTYYAYDRQIPDLDEDGREDGDLVYSGTDHYYATGKVGSTTVYKIKVYTYLEPSDDHNAVWLCEVSKGTEITRSEIHYAASLDGINHPDDDSDDWKDTIEATGVLAGQYLWTRTTTYYRDKNDPDREPTRTYSVARWGIDGDGISEIDSYYTCMLDEINDMATYEKTHTVSWYYTFESAIAATGKTIGELQGWYIWEKTQIVYDMAPAPDGSARPKPDLVNYRVTRIGQDGQIGQEEYYCLREFDTYEEAFPPSFAWAAPFDVGIQWYNQRNPAADDWRLFNSDSWVDKICTEQTKQYDPWKQTTQHPNCPVWSPIMPAYDENKPTFKFLWNFEQRVDGMGTQYATKPICIGNHARGIKGVIELYALSASQTPKSASILIPQDLYDKNGYGVIPTSGFTDKQVWSDEKYDRAPTEQLPYQWNWTRTLYDVADANGKTYEDHYHVSSVKGTKGEDGAGVEYIYCRTKDANPPQGYNNHAGNVPSYGHIEASDTMVIGGTTYPRCRCEDDFVPDAKTVSGVTYTWTDNPIGITQEYPYEWVCERKSESYLLNGKFSGGHIWGEFSAPKERSKWGYNGEDGDGTEYVFMRTKNDVAPAFSANDVISGYTSDYKSDEWRPYINNKDACGAESNRTTDDPRGTTRDWPYEWVAKRNKAAAASKTAGETQGQRQWKSYYECTADNSHKMSKWSTYSTLRLDIDNEMDSVMTTAELVITAARTVETVVRLYDGNTEVDLSSAAIGSGGIGLTGEPASSIATRNDPTASGKGRKLSWTFKKDATMSARYVIGISYTYNGQTYQASFTIVASAGTDVYQLRPTYDKIGFRRTSTNLLDPSSVTLGMNVEKITNKGATKMTVAESGQTVRYSTSTMPDKKTDGFAWPSDGVAVAADGNVNNVFVAMFDTAGNLLDRETVPIVRDGKNGENTVRLDLDNENDSMLYTGGGTLVSGNVTSTAYMFDGASDVSGSTTFSISAREGCTSSQATISGRVITVTGINAATAKVTVQGVYKDGNNNTHTKTAVLTIKKIVDGDKYDLVISPNAIPYNATTDTPATTTVSIKVYKTSVNNSGGATRALSAPPSGYSVFAGSMALDASSTGTYSTKTDNSEISSLTVKIAKSATSTDILDIETIPIAKAENGKDGKTPTISIGDNKHWIINGVDTGIKAEGTDGTGVAIKGEVANKAAREALTNVSKGDCYIQTDNRHLYMWDGETWIDLGEFKGEPGKSSYVHIAYATSITFNGSTISAVTGFTVDNAGIEYDWWGFCTDNNETDPGRGASSTDVTAARKYKWNYMKGKDGAGVEYIYLLTKEGFTPTIDESGGASGHSDKTKDEFYPKVGNWSSYKTSIYNQSQYWSDDPPASVSIDWPMLWWAKREYKFDSSTGTSAWGSFGLVTLHNRYSKDGQSSFTSHVFKRQNSQPSAPSGGSYSSPVPSGWSDGVPDGTAMVWMSTRIFSSDGKVPQQSAWTTPRQMTDTADFDVEFSSVASPNPPSGHPNTNTQWGNTSSSSTIWMATSECRNGVWSEWQVAKIKGEKGDQGKYEEKQYGRSSSSTSYADAYMDSSLDGNKTWIDRIPLPSKAYPFIWQRSRVYNPADGSYGSWQYVRLTGEPGKPGSPGATGKWYRYAGIWGVDTRSVTNTEKVGWYVKYGSNWYMNVKADGSANTTTPGAGVEGWDVMNSTFDYYIAKAYFGDHAHLGSFVINGDWMISQHGYWRYSAEQETYITDFTSNPETDAQAAFKPSDPMGTGSAGYPCFAPQFAVDAKTGRVYMQDAYVKGEIHATSGSFSGTVNASGSFRVVNSSNQSVVRVQAGRASETTVETYVTILDEAGIYSHKGNDGFRLNASNGLQRYDSRNGWGPMFAGRRVDKVTAAKTLDDTYDFIIADPSNYSGGFTITLPYNPPDGKIITIQCTSYDRWVDVQRNTIGYIKVLGQASGLPANTFVKVRISNFERGEFVAFGGNWYATKSVWD